MRKLGQHFLKSAAKIKKIVDALEIEPNDTIIEIGPGHGELTKELGLRIKNLGGGGKIIAVEKDKELTKDLRLGIKELGLKNVEVIEGDALKVLREPLKSLILTPKSCYKIVGNIPYYITGRLLRILGDLKKKPKIVVLTVQKEVAERITAKPPQMNLLAASVQFWAKPKIIDFISKNDFRPMPKVDSAIVKLKTYNLKLITADEAKNYYKLIKILFKQPRKTILNNLKSGFSLSHDELIKKLREMGINPNDRPQNLSVETITKLSQMLYNE